MRAREFISQLQQEEIVASIRKAEQLTSGEIRVFISRQEPENAVIAAEEHFTTLGMHQTEEKNGVLIYVAPRVQKFAVIGDKGVHERCGQVFWEEIAVAMKGHFKKNEFTHGILYGVQKAGELLAKHFPRKTGDKNELSDDIAQD